MTSADQYVIKTIKPYRVWIPPAWKDAPITDFIKTIKTYTESADREILLDSRNRVVRGEMKNARGKTVDVVIKQFRKLKPYDTARFTVIRSKALRSFLNALELKNIGILTPEPILCAEKRDGAFLLESYYLCRYVDFDFSLHEMFRDGMNKPWETLLKELAIEVQKIHDAGILFGDLNGANILIKIQDKKPLLYFIDLNRIKLRAQKKMTDAAKAFDLSWLGIPLEWGEFFLEAYTGKSDSPIHHSYYFALKYRRRVDEFKKVRKLWRRK